VDGVRAADVEVELERLPHEMGAGDGVRVWTGTNLEAPGYDLRHAGLRRDATELLVDRGVRLIGIDAWGLDRPFDVMAEEAKAGNTAQLWESHILGRSKEYCQIERLANLELLPRATGFTVYAFPYLVEGASAGWTRVVAIFEENA
jgi:kynurenine formamidase